MGSHQPTFADILDHLAGREDPAVARLLADDSGAADAPGRLLRATRAAGRAPRLSRSLARRALRIYRDQMRPARPTLLELLFDSLRTPAPALRKSARYEAPRFMKFGTADVGVELQFARIGRGIELRGQITPADYAPEVELELRGRVRRTGVDANGAFRFASLASGSARLTIGPARIEDLEI